MELQAWHYAKQNIESAFMPGSDSTANTLQGVVFSALF
jgi:hypothetical protein